MNLTYGDLNQICVSLVIEFKMEVYYNVALLPNMEQLLFALSARLQGFTEALTIISPLHLILHQFSSFDFLLVPLMKLFYILSCVQTTAKDSALFDHLINIWEFNQGPAPGTCNLHFLVDFKFQSPFYRQVMTLQLMNDFNMIATPI